MFTVVSSGMIFISILCVIYLFSACITIVANDNAYGVFSFDEDSLSATLTEAGDTVMENNGGYMEYSANKLIIKFFYPLFQLLGYA